MNPSSSRTAAPLPDSPYFVLLADNHAIVRVGLKTLIGNLDKNVLLYEAAGSNDIIAKLRSRPFDLLIIDINMRQMESFSLVTYIRRAFPALDVLVFTMDDELLFATRFLRRGVKGFLHKQTDKAEIMAAYTALRTGQTYISDAMSRKISGHPLDKGGVTPFEQLTDREFEVILQILGGNSPEQIAKTLNLDKSTVGTHKCRILKKLKVENNAELIELAKRHGLF